MCSLYMLSVTLLPGRCCGCDVVWMWCGCGVDVVWLWCGVVVVVVWWWSTASSEEKKKFLGHHWILMVSPMTT